MVAYDHRQRTLTFLELAEPAGVGPACIEVLCSPTFPRISARSLLDDIRSAVSVAEVVRFLLSDDAPFVTGRYLVEGGYAPRRSTRRRISHQLPHHSEKSMWIFAYGSFMVGKPNADRPVVWWLPSIVYKGLHGELGYQV